MFIHYGTNNWLVKEGLLLFGNFNLTPLSFLKLESSRDSLIRGCIKRDRLRVAI